MDEALPDGASCLIWLSCNQHDHLWRAPALHFGIIWPAAPFGADPGDVLAWIFDIASFAMHAILRIDLELRDVFFVHYDLVNSRRAIALRRFGVIREVGHCWNQRVVQYEVNGLFFLMIGG